MNGQTKTRASRAILRQLAAAAALLFLVAPEMPAQRNGQRQSAPRTTAPQNRSAQPRMQQPRMPQREMQQRQTPQMQNRQFQNQQRQFENRALPARPQYSPRPLFPQSPNTVRPVGGFQGQRNAPQPQTAPRPGVNAPAQGARSFEPAVRPALPAQGFTRNPASTPGHLGSWLNQHSNLPVQGQEQLLRNDPSFKRLPQSDQQRLMQQLQQVNKLPEQQRERRLARAETIERMSPQERMQLNQSTRQLSTLPADRQTLVKRAFRDLRGVPLDQRQTVLDSQRYQGQFSPEERGILGNLLRAEPYQPQQ